MDQNWLVIALETNHGAAEVLTDYLSSLGAAGVEVVDRAELESVIGYGSTPDYQAEEFLEDLDEIVTMKAYFPIAEGAYHSAGDDPRITVNRELQFTGKLYDDAPKTEVPLSELTGRVEKRLAELGEFFDDGGRVTGIAQVEDADWAEQWKQYYETIHINDKLVINPGWLEYEPEEGEIVISLDPGSAFGTGSHDTTAMCLQLLSETAMDDTTQILDLGTGSGILAIGAAKLGGERIEAIDIDPNAVRVATENMAINGVSCETHAGELKDARHAPYDLIIANLIADLLVDLAAEIAAKLRHRGILIASGIIDHRLAEVEEAFAAAGLEIIETRSSRDWKALKVIKP